MQLSSDAINEFKAIYAEEYGTTLSESEARDMAGRVLQLFAVIMRPLPVIDLDNLSSSGMVDGEGPEHAPDDAS